MKNVDIPTTSDPGAQKQPRLRQYLNWKALLPVGVAIVIALIPAPEGLASHAWYFFAIFAACNRRTHHGTHSWAGDQPS
jgi:hypothetical protein